MKNTLLRKILCAAMSAMMLLSLTACGDKTNDDGKSNMQLRRRRVS